MQGRQLRQGFRQEGSTIDPNLPAASETGRPAASRPVSQSWWCDQCSVEVYQLRCQHCGKTKRERT